MPLEQILRDFHLARERLLMHVEELDPSLFARQAVHPRLKTPMRLVDHLYFVAERDDHHLASNSGIQTLRKISLHYRKREAGLPAWRS
jgi:hypothetical protein